MKNTKYILNIFNNVHVLAITCARPRNCMLVKNVPISNREVFSNAISLMS